MALRAIIHHYVRDNPAVIRANDLDDVVVWQIDVQEISARLHHPTAEWQEALGIKETIADGYHYNSDGKILVLTFKHLTAPQNDEQQPDTGASASIKK